MQVMQLPPAANSPATAEQVRFACKPTGIELGKKSTPARQLNS